MDYLKRYHKDVNIINITDISNGTINKKEKKPFNWGKFVCNVLGGLAIVAVAALAAPVLGAIAIGGELSGTAAVVSMAVSYKKHVKASACARESFVGALKSGALHYGGK